MWAIKTAEFTTFALCAAVILFVVFQVAVPILKGTKLFPFLYHKRKEVMSSLTAAREEKELLDAQTEAEAIIGSFPAPNKSKKR
jgi:hypothetical protein